MSKITRAAHEIVLEAYARTNSKCESIEPPSIGVDQPPEHGVVCSRLGDVKLRATVENNLTQCLSGHARGVHVVYLPRKDYVGPDKVRYTVRFPTTQHSVEVSISVVPADAWSAAGVPGDISAPIMDTPEQSGPLPLCTALVSWLQR